MATRAELYKFMDRDSSMNLAMAAFALVAWTSCSILGLHLLLKHILSGPYGHSDTHAGE